MRLLCKKHGLTEHRDRSDNGGTRCRRCAVEQVTKRRRKLKQMAVDYLGGKCVRCGYDKCIAALDFHHLDPSKKNFGISSGNTKAWNIIKRELDKCELVCSNCHREEHSD